MTQYQALITKSASAQLDDLSPSVQERVANVIDLLSTGDFSHSERLPVGEEPYQLRSAGVTEHVRIIFAIDTKEHLLTVVRFGLLG